MGARTRAGVVVAVAATLSCGPGPEPLLGTWVSVDAPGPRMTYVFEPEGQAGWILETEAGPDTFPLAYGTDRRTDPAHLDMGPWESGPLEGRTLYGIVRFQGPDRFLVDFEPGDPNGDGQERPDTFTSQTVTFVRKRN